MAATVSLNVSSESSSKPGLVIRLSKARSCNEFRNASDAAPFSPLSWPRELTRKTR